MTEEDIVRLAEEAELWLHTDRKYEAVEKFGNDFRRNPVGTGPFMFTYWKEGVKLILQKNTYYFEKTPFGKFNETINRYAFPLILKTTR
jgi:ABC-type transport system substrate-binding protein